MNAKDKANISCNQRGTRKLTYSPSKSRPKITHRVLSEAMLTLSIFQAPSVDVCRSRKYFISRRTRQVNTTSFRLNSRTGNLRTRATLRDANPVLFLLCNVQGAKSHKKAPFARKRTRRVTLAMSTWHPRLLFFAFVIQVAPEKAPSCFSRRIRRFWQNLTVLLCDGKVRDSSIILQRKLGLIFHPALRQNSTSPIQQRRANLAGHRV